MGASGRRQDQRRGVREGVSGGRIRGVRVPPWGRCLRAIGALTTEDTPEPRSRRGRVKSAPRDVWGALTEAVARPERGLLSLSENPFFTQELTMADLAFVVTTVAIFALVAFIAKGVAKL